MANVFLDVKFLCYQPPVQFVVIHYLWKLKEREQWFTVTVEKYEELKISMFLGRSQVTSDTFYRDRVL